MNNYKIVEVDGNYFVVINNNDGGFTTISKEIWDEQQKAAELGGTL